MRAESTFVMKKDAEEFDISKDDELNFTNYLRFFASKIAKVRYIFVRDTSAARRAEWVAETYGDVKSYEFSDNATHFLTDADGPFDVLLIGCQDVSRFKPFLRVNAPLLENKVKLCLLSSGNVQRRGRALTAGFDDVFDVTRVQPLEAQARTFAIWRRYRMTMAVQDKQRMENVALSAICDLRHISPRQMRALEYLAEHKNRVVQYRTLCQAIGGREAYISDANLKVIICHLRKLLRPGYRITARQNLGYILHAEEGI